MTCTMMPLRVATTAIALMVSGDAPVSRSNTSASGAFEAASSAAGTATSATHATST